MTQFPLPAEAADRHVTVGTVRLHLLDYGGEPAGGETRPVLLCVHGSAANAHWFDHVAAGLRTDYRVLSLDQRGHGDSAWAADADYSYERYALDLAGVVEQLEFDHIVLVGHSMGGMVSLKYSATGPSRVSRLVVVDTTMTLSPDRVAMLRGIGDRPGRSYSTQAEFVANYRLRPAGVAENPQMLLHIARTGCREFDDGLWRPKFDRKVYATRVGIEGLPYWSQVRIPALYIKGAVSDRMTDSVAEQMRALCPSVQFGEVPASNHHVTLENPSGFNAVLRRFLEAPQPPDIG